MPHQIERKNALPEKRTAKKEDQSAKLAERKTAQRKDPNAKLIEKRESLTVRILEASESQIDKSSEKETEALAVKSVNKNEKIIEVTVNLTVRILEKIDLLIVRTLGPAAKKEERREGSKIVVLQNNQLSLFA
ncbi:MAG: hypothetical protein ACJAT2_001166 [Bacteriovoracaceae bacterium]